MDRRLPVCQSLCSVVGRQRFQFGELVRRRAKEPNGDWVRQSDAQKYNRLHGWQMDCGRLRETCFIHLYGTIRRLHTEPIIVWPIFRRTWSALCTINSGSTKRYKQQGLFHKRQEWLSRCFLRYFQCFKQSVLDSFAKKKRVRDRTTIGWTSDLHHCWLCHVAKRTDIPHLVTPKWLVYISLDWLLKTRLVAVAS